MVRPLNSAHCACSLVPLRHGAPRCSVRAYTIEYGGFYACPPVPLLLFFLFSPHAVHLHFEHSILMSYNSDRADWEQKQANQSEMGSLDQWNHLAQQRNYASAAAAEEEHRQTAEYLSNLQSSVLGSPGSTPWTGGTASASAYTGLASHKHPRAGGSPWSSAIVWLLLWAGACVWGYHMLEQSSQSRHDPMWLNLVHPKGQISEGLLKLYPGTPSLVQMHVDTHLKEFSAYYRNPGTAAKAFLACGSRRACVGHPMGVLGYLSAQAKDSGAYWQALCDAGRRDIYRYTSDIEVTWTAKPHPHLKNQALCVATNAPAVNATLAERRQREEGINLAVALAAALAPALWVLWRRTRKAGAAPASHNTGRPPNP